MLKMVRKLEERKTFFHALMHHQFLLEHLGADFEERSGKETRGVLSIQLQMSAISACFQRRREKKLFLPISKSVSNGEDRQVA